MTSCDTGPGYAHAEATAVSVLYVHFPGHGSRHRNSPGEGPLAAAEVSVATSREAAMNPIAAVPHDEPVWATECQVPRTFEHVVILSSFFLKCARHPALRSERPD